MPGYLHHFPASRSHRAAGAGPRLCQTPKGEKERESLLGAARPGHPWKEQGPELRAPPVPPSPFLSSWGVSLGAPPPLPSAPPPQAPGRRQMPRPGVGARVPVWKARQRGQRRRSGHGGREGVSRGGVQAIGSPFGKVPEGRTSPGRESPVVAVPPRGASSGAQSSVRPAGVPPLQRASPNALWKEGVGGKQDEP